jgi:hypothetical protein
MSRKNRTAKIAPAIVEAPAPVEAAPAPAPVEAAPVVAVEAAPAPAKVLRYAPGRFAPSWVITILPAGIPNPKRGKSRVRFGWLESGQTVAQYVQKSVDMGGSAANAHLDLRWNVQHGLCAIEAPTVE